MQGKVGGWVVGWGGVGLGGVKADGQMVYVAKVTVCGRSEFQSKGGRVGE